jgi:IS5 family transposase
MRHNLAMRSKIHPKYKTKYRVNNWPEYDHAVVQRGNITLWISDDAIASWKPAPTGRRGAQRKFSDHAIETALTLRLVFKLPLRQAEGFLRSILSLIDVDLEAPDHTTLSRRSQLLDVALHLISTKKPMHLSIDSTGLSIVGEGEWAAAKHGGRGRRGWKKLHIGVDRSGLIVAEALTHGSADDAKTAVDLIDSIEGGIESLTADAAYDTLAIYDASAARGAEVVVPPVKSATRSRRRRPQSSARDRTIMRVKEIGRRQWKKESGYPHQARVENTFFRYKTTIGPRLHSGNPEAQEAEALMACNILDRMMAVGRPESFAIGGLRNAWNRPIWSPVPIYATTPKMSEEFAMKNKRCSVEQIVAGRKQAELGTPVADSASVLRRRSVVQSGINQGFEVIGDTQAFHVHPS